MTILFLSRLFYPHIGGVEKHVLEVGKRLVKKNHKVILITEKYQSSDSSAKFTGEADGIKIHRIDVGKDDFLKKIRIWRELWKLRSLIKTSDIVHCHDVFFWYLPFRFLYPKKPIFTTFHGYESYPVPKNALIVRKISEKLSWGNICVGDYIEKWYGTKPDYVTYGGVEISNIKHQASNKVKKESAVFIGRLDEQTGIKMYVDAVKLIRKKIPRFKFTVIGDGKLKKDIEKYVQVLGFQKDPEKYFEQYRFAFVSRYLSILEAMASRRLVFAVYDNPIKKDYLQMTPFAPYIVIENNAEDIAKRVGEFLNDTRKEQVINNANKWVQTQSWDETVKIYSKLWSRH